MRHIDLELLSLVVEGHLPPKTLLRAILAHLGEVCPECGETLALLRGDGHGDLLEAEADATTADAPAENALPDPRSVTSLRPAENGAAGWVQRVREERRRARKDLAVLLALPAEQREERVVRARSRFRSRAFAELLLERCRREVHQNAVEAINLAELVPVVVLWTPGALDRSWGRVLRVRAEAWRGNALRVAGDLRAAEQAFNSLRARLAREVLDEPLVHAEVSRLEASLNADQGRLGEALRLLDQAALLYRSEGAAEELAQVLVKRGIVERRSGELEEAAATQREVLRTVAATEHPDLYLQATSNLALALCDLERFAEADELVRRHEPLYRERLRDGAALPLKHQLDGRIAWGCSRLGEAEELLLRSRNGFLEQRRNLSAAILSLDLTALYLEQGRTIEAKRMARLMEFVFAAQDVPQHALAALLVFQKAVLAETMTAEAVRHLRWQLEVGARPAGVAAGDAVS